MSSRAKNNPLIWNQLIEKRLKVYELFQENQHLKISVIEFDEKFKFGKFQDSYVKEIIESHPEYIEWIIDSTDDKCFNFNKNYFFVEQFLNKQHIQLNAIKIEMFHLQKNESLNANSKLPAIPKYYEFIS